MFCSSNTIAQVVGVHVSVRNSLMLRHTVVILNGKPVKRRLPVPDRHRSFFAYVLDRRVEQF